MKMTAAGVPLAALMLLVALVLLACNSTPDTATSKPAPTLEPPATETPITPPATATAEAESAEAPTEEPATAEPVTEEPPNAEARTQKPTPEASEAAETADNTCETPSGKCPDDVQEEVPGAVQEMLGHLPQEELACLEEDFPIGEVWQGPSMPMPEDMEATRALFNCLSDESIARMMITPSFQEEDAVSPETAECIAQGPAGGIIRAIVTGTEPQEEPEAMMGTMLAAMMGMTVVMLDCLSDEEWAERGMEPGDRQMLDCISEQIDMEEMITAVLEQDMEKLEQFGALTETCAMGRPPTNGRDREGAPATPAKP